MKKDFRTKNLLCDFTLHPEFIEVFDCVFFAGTPPDSLPKRCPILCRIGKDLSTYSIAGVFGNCSRLLRPIPRPACWFRLGMQFERRGKVSCSCDFRGGRFSS